MFVYHYHAEYRQPTFIQSIDGIAWTVERVYNMASYRKLKSTIVEGLSPSIPVDRLVIRSLSLLGETDEQRLDE